MNTIVTFRIGEQRHTEVVDCAYFRVEEGEWEVFGSGFRCCGVGPTLDAALQAMVKRIRADKLAGTLEAGAGDAI